MTKLPQQNVLLNDAELGYAKKKQTELLETIQTMSYGPPVPPNTTTSLSKMTNKWDERFLKLAKEVASWSKDPSTKTGAVIVNDQKKVVSVGYNGFPAAMRDDPELYANRDMKYSRIIHCEMNALITAKQDVNFCTLYTYPFPSCDRCVVHMIQAGICCFVAPKPTPEQEERWGPAFEKTRKYIAECGCSLKEVDYE